MSCWQLFTHRHMRDSKTFLNSSCMVDDALLSIYCLQRQSIPDRSISTDVHAETVAIYYYENVTYSSHTNSMKQCVMKSTLVIIFAVMKSVVTLLDSSFCQAEMHDCKKNSRHGVHLTSRSIHPQSQPCLLLKAGSKARINVNNN